MAVAAVAAAGDAVGINRSTAVSRFNDGRHQYGGILYGEPVGRLIDLPQ
jgi:hypothetical protein